MASRRAHCWTWARDALQEREAWRVRRLSRSAFTRFKWEHASDRPSFAYAVFRLFFFVYWAFWVLTSGIVALRTVDIAYPFGSDNDKGEFWLVYVTNWTATLLGVYLLLACLCLSSWFSSRLGCLTWALRTIVGPASLIVMSLYWSTIFPLYWYTDAVDINIHFINAVIMVIDVCVSRIPFLLSHIYLPLTYVATYITFTIMYYVCGGRTENGSRHIYPLLNWGDPGVTAGVVVGVIFIGVPAAHVFLSILDKLTWRACGRDRDCVYEEDEERYGVRDTSSKGGVARGDGLDVLPQHAVEMKQ